MTVLEVLEEALETRDLGAAATPRSIAVKRELLADIERLEPYLDGLALRDLTPEWAARTKRGLAEGRGGRRAYSSTTVHWTLSSLKACVKEYADARGLAIPRLFKLEKPTGSRNAVLNSDDWKRLQMALAGCVWDHETNDWKMETTFDADGNETTDYWRETDPVARRRLDMMYRFKQIGIMTGSRHMAILGVRWSKNAETGYVDLESGILYRAGVSAKGSKTKRVEPVVIAAPLLEMMRAWREEDRRTGAEAPIHQVRRGKLYGKPYRSLRTDAWNDLLRRAGIQSSIKPHSLKKTLTSILLTSDVPLLAVASLLSTRIETLLRHYNAADGLALQRPAAAEIGRAMRRARPISFERVTPAPQAAAYLPRLGGKSGPAKPPVGPAAP